MRFSFLFFLFCLGTFSLHAENAKLAKKTLDEWKKNPYYDASKYKPDFSSELKNRILPAPGFVLDTIGGWDKREYKNYTLSPKERALMESYLDALPAYYKKVLKETLIGFYFVEDNFLGSGFADICFDDQYRAKSFVLINKSTFHVSLSEWLTKKERTCFKKDAEENLKVNINVSDDYLGLFGILLHETSHCVDYVERFTPYVDQGNLLFHMIYDDPVLAPDFSSIWKDDKSKDMSKVNFPLASKITFYGMNKGPKLKINEAKTLYQQLEQSPYVSAYASLIRAEDFAEAAMYYYMVKKLNLDYKIRISEDEKTIYEYEPLKNPRILTRLAFLDQYLLD